VNLKPDTWPTLLGNSILALQPFSARRRAGARKQLATYFLRNAPRGQFAEMLWDVLPGWMDTISFRRDGVFWTGSVRSLITRQLFVEGGFQQEEINHLLEWLKNQYPPWNTRSTIINAGANIGDTCIPMALATEKQFIACEPVAATFAMLCRNVNDNGLQERIRCRQVAVSATADNVKMVLSEELGQCEVEGTEGKQGYPLEHYRAGTVVAPALTLDSLVTMEGHRGNDVALVWSDTQGCEADVLESGASLWQAGTPAWVEVWPAGLNAQGGVDRFIRVSQRFFRRFIESSALRSGRSEPSEIRDLPGIIGLLAGLDYTDVLLLP
jgi:FkbM family methyltransferase